MFGIEKKSSAFVFILVFFVFPSIIISGCGLLGIKVQPGSLQISIDPENQRVFFGPVLEVSSYSLSAIGPDGLEKADTWTTAGAHTLTNLLPGTWDMTISGLDASQTVIVRSVFSIEIVAGQTAEKSVTLLPIAEGNGTLSLSVDWSSLAAAPASPAVVAFYSAADESGTEGYVTMTVDGSSASGSATLSAGYYTLGVTLKDGDSATYLWNPQTFRIVADHETTAAIVSEGSAGGGGTADLELDLAAQSVLKLDFGDKTTLTVKLKNVPAGQLYLGKANTSTLAAEAAATGKATGVACATSKALPKSITGAVKRFDNERAQEFTPPAGLKPKAILPPTQTILFGDEDPAMVVGTTTRAFWVESATGEWIQIEARLRAASDTSYLWIPDSNFSNFSALSYDNLLSSTQVTALNDEFNGTGPVGGEGIRALVSNIFSTEWGGEVEGNGGIDGDQHIHILMYDIDYDYTANQTGGTLGYFWGKDEYSDTLMQQYGYRSNEAEMFYLDIHFTDLVPMMMVSVLAHEYQHMIHFNQKALLRDVNSPTWFNEMCSMVSEDFIGSIVGIPDEDSPRSRIPRFNGYYYDSGVTDWLSGSNVLKSYASAYVFGAYLARNFGGAPLFHDMLRRSEVGPAAVTASMTALGTGTTFNDVFGEYTTAFVFDNPAPEGARSFPALSTSLNGTTYELPGFALSDYGTGPVLFNPDDQRALRPYGNSIHSSSSWVDISESSVVTVEKPDNANVGLYLMYVRR